MSLEVELCLRKPIALQEHEALLSTYHTASCLRKKASQFLQSFGVTDVQFNLMMLLKHQAKGDEGLSQRSLSDMMLVNRANITSLVDRMEKSGFVTRTVGVSDRRHKMIKLTVRGEQLLTDIEPLYAAEVTRIMSVLKKNEQLKLIATLDRIRSNIA